MDYRESNANTELYRLIESLPKIELHRHLEGSLRLSTLAAIAQEFKIELPRYDPMRNPDFYYDIEDFRPYVQIMPDDEPASSIFLSKFKTLRHFYRSPEVIDRVVYEAVADAALENIVYMELRFTPIALAREKNYPLPEVVDWVISAVQRGSADFDMDVRLIVSMNRNEPPELGAQFLDIAIDRMADGIVGIDLAGDENRYPGRPFASIFQKARDAGLAVTIHAGEWAGPESVREAIDLLGARRLGHGVRIIQDSFMVRLARERQIAFEVCPTSNVQSGVSHSLSQHPLLDLYQVGLMTTINTDDPSICGINLTDELVATVEHLGFSLEDLKRNVVNAAHASFLPDPDRSALVQRIEEAFYMVDLQLESRKAS
ncbi:MAG: adenosine deaminase [Chloroflexi bacterium]|nr:adenosine deaminase [Chloroflexota bacterium]